jgi:hypothetical protein
MASTGAGAIQRFSTGAPPGCHTLSSANGRQLGFPAPSKYTCLAPAGTPWAARTGASSTSATSRATHGTP